MSDEQTIIQPQPRKKWPYFAIGAAVVLVVIWVIYWVPQYQVKLLRERIEKGQVIENKDRLQLEKDYVDYANKARTTLAQIIGGLFVLGTIGVALWNARIAQTNAETAQKNLKLTEDTAQKNLAHLESSKITERFSKALELLGSDKWMCDLAQFMRWNELHEILSQIIGR